MTPKVIPVWKKVGQSTHWLAEVLAEKYGVVTAHTGILDPMAEGVVVVLLDEERFLKKSYSEGKKVYVVEILVGISTDTHDLLGIVRKIEMLPLSKTAFDVALSKYRGKFMQAPPSFSAIKYEGKRLFQHAKDGTLETISIKPREVEVFNNITWGESEIAKDVLKDKLAEVLPLIKGDFRQDLITKRWEDLMIEVPKKLQVITFEVTSGPGFYVRSLIRDLGKDLRVPLLSYSLTRTENAGYKKKDCIEI